MSVSTMKKLTVFSSEKDADRIVRRLMNLRCVEIAATDCKQETLPLTRMRCSMPSECSDERMAELRQAIAELTPYTTRTKRLGRDLHKIRREDFYADGRADAAWQTVRDSAALRARLDAIAAEEARLRRLADSLAPWSELDLPFDELSTAQTAVFLGSLPPASTAELLLEELAPLHAFCEIVSENKSGVYVAVTYHKADEDRVTAILAGRGFVRALPEGVTEGTAQENLIHIDEALERHAVEAEREKERFFALAEHLEDVEILYDLLMTDRLAVSHRQKLAQSRTCTVLEGWVPTFTQDAVEAELARFDCAYALDDPSEDEEPPVLLRNNRFAMTFEWVIGMYAYPKYGRFDPTFIMSIFYFILFGMMFADVGYGLLLTLACFGGVRLMHPKPGLRRMMYMFGFCGISSMVQGVIFGGWFGDLPTALMTNVLHVNVDTGVGHFFGSGLWFNPLDDPMTFLILSLAVGGVHLVAGMAVRFYVLCKDGQAGEALCTILPFWVLFAGLVLLLLMPSIGTYVALAGVALILVLNGYGVRNPIKRLIKGLGGLYGLINYASDLLSYSRILALGLVAGVIAKVINLITMMGSNAIGFVVMLIVLIAGHVLNLAINVLGTFVHTSRLQYIEFFGKFYEDGGRPFEPALPSEEYTEEME